MQRLGSLFWRWDIEIKVILFLIFVSMFCVDLILITPTDSALDKIPANEQFTRKMELFKFERKIVDDATEKIKYGIPYSLSDYFKDLTASCRKSEELFGVKGMNFADSPMGELQRTMELNWPGGRTSKEVELARAPYKEYLDAWIKGDYTPVDWSNVRAYLWSMYFRYMLLAVLLFFLWVQEGYRGDELVFPSPLSFSVITAVYPFVIAYHAFRWFRREGRSIVAEAEIRRMNRLYAYISPEDLQKIRDFAKSNLSLSHWRQQLAGLGLKPRHSFAAALLVSIVFVFVIRPAEAGAKSVKKNVGLNSAIEQIAETKNLARGNIEWKKFCQGEKHQKQQSADSRDLALATIFMPIPTIRTSAVILKIIIPAANIFREIFHIPLSVVGCEVSLCHFQT